MIIENYKKDRYPFIDLLKGICILLVVLYHFDAWFPKLSLLRMPLYFFLSGLFFSRYSSLAVFTVKRVNRIIVPFLFFFLLSLIYQVVKCSFINDYSILSPSLLFSEKLSVNTPLWFLISLFEVTMIYYFISSIKSRIWQAIWVFTISILGYWVDQRGIDLYFYLDSSMMALVFFYFGAALRRNVPRLFEKQKSDYFVVIISGIVFGITLVFVEPINVLNNTYKSNYFLILLSSCSAIVFLLYSCKRIGSIPIINYFGQYSLVVLGMHEKLFGIFKYVLPDTWEMLIVSVIVNFAIIYVAIQFLLAYFPQFIAQAPFVSINEGWLCFNFRHHTISLDKRLNVRTNHHNMFIASHRRE